MSLVPSTTIVETATSHMVVEVVLLVDGGSTKHTSRPCNKACTMPDSPSLTAAAAYNCPYYRHAAACY